MPALTDLPVDLMIIRVMQDLLAPDLLRLSQVNRSLEHLVSKVSLWKLQCRRDFESDDLNLDLVHSIIHTGTLS